MAENMSEEDEALTGTTLRVYRYALRIGKPIGVREVYRALNFSSPTLSSYHLSKLERAGLLKQTSDGYVVDKVIFHNFIRLRRSLIPRYLFYSLFFGSITIIELFFFRPPILTREYMLVLVVSFLAASSYLYETVRIWVKNKI